MYDDNSASLNVRLFWGQVSVNQSRKLLEYESSHFTWGISSFSHVNWLPWFWRLKLLWSGFWKQENQDSQWRNLFWVQWFENQGNTNDHIWETMDVPALKERANLPFLHLSVLFRSLTDWMIPIHVIENSFLYSVCWFKA